MKTGLRQHKYDTSLSIIIGFILLCFTTPLYAHNDILEHTHLSADSILYHFGSWIWFGVLALLTLPTLHYLHRRFKARNDRTSIYRDQD